MHAASLIERAIAGDSVFGRDEKRSSSQWVCNRCGEIRMREVGMDGRGAKPFAHVSETLYRSTKSMIGPEGSDDDSDAGFPTRRYQRSLRRQYRYSPAGYATGRGIEHMTGHATEVANGDDPQRERRDESSRIWL
jgi:hypothetical protein